MGPNGRLGSQADFDYKRPHVCFALNSYHCLGRKSESTKGDINTRFRRRAAKKKDRRAGGLSGIRPKH
jgi:hypothetical protein